MITGTWNEVAATFTTFFGTANSPIGFFEKNQMTLSIKQHLSERNISYWFNEVKISIFYFMLLMHRPIGIILASIIINFRLGEVLCYISVALSVKTYQIHFIMFAVKSAMRYEF